MIRKFLPILMLAGLTACASNSRISSAPSAADTSGTASATDSSNSSSSSADSGSGSSSDGGAGDAGGASSFGGSSHGGSSGSGSMYGGSGYGSATGGDSSYSSQPSANCDAQPVQKMIGTKLTDDVAEQARKASTSSRIRVLKPGEVMTMEYDPTRLNLILDKQGALTALRCG